MQVMTLSSSAWPDGGQIPAKYTQEGEDVSPPLAWSGAPDGVVSYVLLVHDPTRWSAPAPTTCCIGWSGTFRRP